MKRQLTAAASIFFLLNCAFSGILNAQTISRQGAQIYAMEQNLHDIFTGNFPDKTSTLYNQDLRSVPINEIMAETRYKQNYYADILKSKSDYIVNKQHAGQMLELLKNYETKLQAAAEYLNTDAALKTPPELNAAYNILKEKVDTYYNQVSEGLIKPEEARAKIIELEANFSKTYKEFYAKNVYSSSRPCPLINSLPAGEPLLPYLKELNKYLKNYNDMAAGQKYNAVIANHEPKLKNFLPKIYENKLEYYSANLKKFIFADDFKLTQSNIKEIEFFLKKTDTHFSQIVRKASNIHITNPEVGAAVIKMHFRTLLLSDFAQTENARINLIQDRALQAAQRAKFNESLQQKLNARNEYLKQSQAKYSTELMEQAGKEFYSKAPRGFKLRLGNVTNLLGVAGLLVLEAALNKVFAAEPDYSYIQDALKTTLEENISLSQRYSQSPEALWLFDPAQQAELLKRTDLPFTDADKYNTARNALIAMQKMADPSTPEHMALAQELEQIKAARSIKSHHIEPAAQDAVKVYNAKLEFAIKKQLR